MIEDRPLTPPPRSTAALDLQPILIGALLELRPLAEEDFDALYRVASDPLVWEQHPNPDRYRETVFREFFREAMESGGAFAVIDRSTGKIIGSSRFAGYDEVKREIEIGWTFLVRSHWGGTYNGEMKRLMLRHVFPHVDRVLFFIGKNNLRSQRAVGKLGAVRIGSKVREAGGENYIFELTERMYERATMTPTSD